MSLAIPCATTTRSATIWKNYYRPNLRVKSRDTLTPIGPWIVAKEAIPDPHNLALRTGSTANCASRAPPPI